MQAWGAPAEEVDRVRAQIASTAPAQQQESFGVYAENIPSVNAFVALRTQWQYAGMDGQRVGLNYAAATAWLTLHLRPRRRRAVMTDLQTMESAVLIADRELQKKEE